MTIASIIAQFPDDFTFGVATSSYQIEGSHFGNCGQSHWDSFAQVPNAVFGQEDGGVGCDHYHRWQEDLDLISQGGFGAYRFSFSWPRLLPQTHQGINPDGISFYDKLIDGMLERGIAPHATFYHWDLPQRLADKGGWTNRDTAHYFADYTDVVMRHFGDRLTSVAPVNEPWCVAWLSHYLGHHAPGLRDINAAGKAMHIIQLAHGLSAQVAREHGHKNIGCVLNKEFAVPADDSAETIRLAHLYDGIYSRWFEESIFNARYPDDVLEVIAPYLPEGWQDDMAVIATPLDWVGVNYYTRAVIAPDKTEALTGLKTIAGDLPKTDMNWEVAPEGLSFFLRRLAKEYAPDLPIYITENGMANADRLTDNAIPDTARISYFESHLAEVAQVIEDGIAVKGYFAWSLLDNYEWAFGYDKRFGLVHVDFETQKRTPKDSYYAWQKALER